MKASGSYIDVYLNNCVVTSAFVDSGCLCLATVSPRLVKKSHANIIPISPRSIAQVINDPNPPRITAITSFNMDVGGQQERLFAYIVLLRNSF